MLRFLLFVAFLLTFCFSRSYQFKVINNNSDNTQENSVFFLIIATLDDLILETKQDNFFYDATSNKKEFSLEQGKEYSYTFSTDNKSVEGSFVAGGGEVINFDAKVLFDKNTKKNLREISKIRAKKKVKELGNGISLLSAEARLIPGAGNDILQSVTSLPGVGGTSRNGEIYIRGSDKDDIFYALNYIRISNPFHSVGFYSAIPNIVIRNLNVYLGGFDNSFPNVQGGVIQVIPNRIENYIARRPNVEADISFVAASLNVNVPINNDMRINIGGKRSYYEFYLSILDAINFFEGLGFDEFELKPFFYDYNIFYDWKINKNFYFRAFAITSDDAVSLRGVATLTNERTNITSSFAIETDDLWNTQALELIILAKGFENDLSIYHYGITNTIKQNGRTTFSYQRNYFTIKDNFSLELNDMLAFKGGAALTYEVADFLSRRHPEGKKIPTPNDYGVSFGRGGPTPVENFEEYNEAFTNYQAELEDIITSPSRWVSETHLVTDIVIFNMLDFNFGVNVDYNDYFDEKFYYDFRGKIVYRFNDQLFFFVKGGKYSQLAELFFEFTRSNNGGGIVVEEQSRYLKTPYSYHINVGGDMQMKIFDFNFNIALEGYYKFLTNQILQNPTFDTAFDEDQEKNPKVFNDSDGFSYGFDLFVKQSFSKSSFGWFSYSWNISQRRQFVRRNQFRETITTLLENNGEEYKNLEKKMLPFSEHIEHTFKFLYSIEIISNVQLGINANLLSGKPFTKIFIGESTLLDGSKIFIPEEGDRFNGRLPWRFTLDVRVDWMFFKTADLTIGVYLDLQNIHTTFLKDINGYSYDTSYIDKRSKNFVDGLKVGDPFPEEGISASTSGDSILPVIGVMARY